MKHRCPTCGKLIQQRVDTYWYNESGLDNVHINNITIYECTCGESYPSIFRVSRLNELIAKALLQKNSLLSGNEIKFLRKNIYFSSKDFSAALGIGKTTLSKWENERQHHSETNDRLIRNTYIIHKGIKSREAQKILKHLSKIRLEDSEIYYSIQAQFFQDDYIVRMQPIFESQTQKTDQALLSSKEFQAPHAGAYEVYSGLSIMETNQVFFSDRLLYAVGSETNIYGLELGGQLNADQKTKI